MLEAEPVPPCRSGASVTPSATQSAPVPCGPSSPLCPGMASMVQPHFFRFQRQMTRRLRRVHQKENAPPTAHRADRRNVLLQPQHVEVCVIATNRVRAVSARSISRASIRPSASGGTSVS